MNKINARNVKQGKQNGEKALVRNTRRTVTSVSVTVIMIIVAASSAWYGTRLGIEGGLHWWEAAPIPGTMDLMMITMAFRIYTPGLPKAQYRWAARGMRFGLGLSVVINVVSAYVNTTLDQPWSWTRAQVTQVGASWIITTVLFLLVEALTAQDKVTREQALVSVPKAVKKLTETAAQRQAREDSNRKARERRAAKRQAAKADQELEALVNA